MTSTSNWLRRAALCYVWLARIACVSGAALLGIGIGLVVDPEFSIFFFCLTFLCVLPLCIIAFCVVGLFVLYGKSLTLTSKNTDPLS